MKKVNDKRMLSDQSHPTNQVVEARAGDCCASDNGAMHNNSLAWLWKLFHFLTACCTFCLPHYNYRVYLSLLTAGYLVTDQSLMLVITCKLSTDCSSLILNFTLFFSKEFSQYINECLKLPLKDGCTITNGCMNRRNH